MHEYSIVQSLIARVGDEVRARGALGVHRLSVEIGALSGVEPVLLSKAYMLFREGTVCAKAELEIHRIDERWACPKCETPVTPGQVLSCGACGSPAQLVAGGDIILKQIEMEVP